MGVLGYLMGVLGYLMGVLRNPMAAAPGPGPGPRHFLRPQRHLAMGLRRRQVMGTPSNWERPVNGNAIPFNGNALLS